MGKKKLGADVPSTGVDRFNAYCEKQGYNRGATAGAAFILLELAPAELRDLVMGGNEKAVRRWFDDLLAARLAQEVKRALERERPRPPKGQPVRLNKATGTR